MIVPVQKDRVSKFRYSVVLRVTLLMSLGALVWIIGMLQVEAWEMMLIPAAYLVISLVTFIICKNVISPKLSCTIQMVVSILFPCLFQLVGGGTMATGAVMVWSVVGLFCVSVYSKPRETLKWAIYTVIVLAVTLVYENSPWYHFPSILPMPAKPLLLFNVIATFAIIFYVGFFFVRTMEKVRKRLTMAMDEVKALNASLSLKNEVNNESLRHASEIQSAFMQREDQLRTVFTKVMLLREVYQYVSGNFIWAHEERGFKYVLCGDCRTSGSSGAMLSMLMATTAERILKEQKFVDPGKFLMAFNQSIHEMSSLDLSNLDLNMAVSMLIIDNQSGEVKLATAGGQVLVRRKRDDGKCEVDFYQVDGGYLGGMSAERDFQSMTVPLKDGDMVYMFAGGLLQTDDSQGVFTRQELTDVVCSLDTDYLTSQKRTFIKEINRVNKNREEAEDVLICAFEFERE